MTAALALVVRLHELGLDAAGAHGALDILLDRCTPFELACLSHDWRGTWARPEQLLPASDWRSCGFLTGRRWGKTRAIAEWITSEVQAGRCTRIGMMAQNEERGVAVMVSGKSGLLAVSPPWFRARWSATAKCVVWPNGARALLYTPEVPQAIRGDEYEMFWGSELAYWPKATREEALSNALLSTSIGYARFLWDTTPRRRHPLIRTLLQRCEADPAAHRLVTGTIHENAANLGRGVIKEFEDRYGGTVRGREELLGEWLTDDEAALFRESWIDQTRRHMPDKLIRRIVSVDPAITADPRFSDATGIVEMGLGVDGQVYLLSVALTGRHRAEVWPGLVIDAYTRGGCDVVLLETNRGGTALVALLRPAAHDRGLEVVELGKDEKPHSRPGVVYVRCYHSRGSKADRAAGAAALCEKGRVSFLLGEDFSEFEERLYMFEGDTRGADDDIDAFVAGCHELGALGAADALSIVRGQLDGLAARTRQALRPGATHAFNHREPVIRDLADRRLATRRAPRKMW